MLAQRLIGAAPIAALVLIAACTTGKGAARTDSAGAPNVVTVTATDYAFEAPDTIAAGFTTIRLMNQGQSIHYAHMVRLEPGRTAQEFIDAYAEAIRTSGPRPTWIVRSGGTAAGPNDEGNATQYLEPGNYVWICPVEDSAGIPNFSKGMVRPFVVRADGGSQSGSESTLAIRLLDFTFAVDTPLTAGRHVIRVENRGGEPHDVMLFKLGPGTTMEEVRTRMNPERVRRPREPEPDQGPLDVTLAGGVAVIAPGMEAFFEAELTAGEYVLVCFTTAPDGRSHIEHGMIQQVRIGQSPGKGS